MGGHAAGHSRKSMPPYGCGVGLLEVQQNRRMLELNRQLMKIVQDKDLLLQQNEFLVGDRRFYRGDQLALVDAARYIEELCAETFAFMGQDWAQHLSPNLSPVMVSTDSGDFGSAAD